MRRIAAALAALLIAGGLSAQTRDSFSAEAGGRLSVKIDKKITKGLHAYISEEVRVDDNFTAFDRFYTTVGISYKPLSWMKLGLEYGLINHYKPSEKVWQTRHRGSFYVQESFKAGFWTLSLRETLRLTHKSYEINEAQGPKNELSAKLRFQAKYRGWGAWKPYMGVEGRLMLNGTYGTIDASYTTYTFSGYSDIYVNKLRAFGGVEWQISQTSALDFKLLADYNCGVKMDLKSDGATIKSFTQENNFAPALSIGYTFSF